MFSRIFNDPFEDDHETFIYEASLIFSLVQRLSFIRLASEYKSCDAEELEDILKFEGEFNYVCNSDHSKKQNLNLF